MADLNRWQGIGRLGNDVELRYMPSGDAVASVSLACDDSYKDKNSGQKVERTVWVRLNVWGAAAETLAKYSGKGKRIYAEGKLENREWEKDGVKRTSTEIRVQNFQIIDWPEDGQGRQRHPQEGAARRPPQQRQEQTRPTTHHPQQPAQDFDSFDDDIPF